MLWAGCAPENSSINYQLACGLVLLQPGYLRPLLPPGPPQQPESFEAIKQDFYDKIMKGESCGSCHKYKQQLQGQQ